MRESKTDNWEQDTDIETRPTHYSELFNIDPAKVQLFIDLRRSQTLRDAFFEKYEVAPHLERFEDFAWQVNNVIDVEHVPYFDALNTRINAVINEYFPVGSAADGPAYNWSRAEVSVKLRHPAVDEQCELIFSGPDASKAEALAVAEKAMLDWWERIVGEPDIDDWGNRGSDGWRRYMFAEDLAGAYRRLKVAARYAAAG